MGGGGLKADHIIADGAEEEGEEELDGYFDGRLREEVGGGAVDVTAALAEKKGSLFGD